MYSNLTLAGNPHMTLHPMVMIWQQHYEAHTWGCMPCIYGICWSTLAPIGGV